MTSPLLDGVPRQRPRTEPSAAPPEAVPGAAGAAGAAGVREALGVSEAVGSREADGIGGVPEAAGSHEAVGIGGVAETAGTPEAMGTAGPVAVAVPDGLRRCRQRLARLLPTPAATPFTFAYGTLLLVTSAVARYAGPAVMDAVYRGSSTDVAHLVRTPLPVLAGSALWIAGGIASPYSLCFLLVLTGLERRTGTLRAACVFLYGHVLATLATEVPVGLAVLAGRLPDSSLHRLDYGISFGVAASLGALAGLLRPWARWSVLAVFVGAALSDLLTLADPMTSAGHLIAVTLGVAAWPAVRRGSARRAEG
ncbi:rhomboid-like protein [Streptomyces sp. SID8499]|uniref:rhomboid-like protein n=2 Tax=unclassified Streptomyces TaxID=2593676 RepID=UPI0031BBC551